MVQAPPLLDMMRQLVGEPSISSTQQQFDQSNHRVVCLLAQWLEDMGFTCNLIPVDEARGKYNLIATRGTGTRGLLLSGHSDTVPCDEQLWTSDPFKLTERDHRYYGLGTCDMKCFFALVIEALRGLPVTLSAPVTILATCDEESSMSGARALSIEQISSSAYALIGEPTNLAPVHCHKGIMMLGIRIKGRSGHSSNPALGRNAMDALAPVLNELTQFRSELQLKHQNSAFAVTIPTLNLGCIHGGDNPNRICDQVDLQIDLRVLPGMDNRAIKQQLEERLVNIISNHDLAGSVMLLHPPVPAFETAGDSKLRRCLESITRKGAGSVAFATEAPFLSKLNLDTVVMGPGSINQAHQPNEFIESEQLDATIDIIQRLVAELCISS